ncbi:MAG: cytidine deaminase [Gemmatimonadales bacterium]
MGDRLLDLAREAMTRAHAPYSGYRVGAAIEAMDGRVFAGCNVENASYGLTICAERVALGSAVAAGALAFRRVLIVTERGPAAAPCGACRQVLAEFGLALQVISVGEMDERRWNLAELLPEPFRLNGPRKGSE